MDLTASIIPKSDQWNADDLISGPVTVTIESVTKGSDEQPADVHLVETPGRAYRPSKSMRRVLVVAWGKESDAYTGHRLTLFRNPKIKFGGQAVGGIEIAAMSHLDKPFTLALTRSRGKREPFTVEPLTETAPAKATRKAAESAEPTVADVAACTDVGALKVMYDAAGSPEMRAQIRARKAELNTPVATPPAPNDGPGPSDADWDAMGARAGEPA